MKLFGRKREEEYEEDEEELVEESPRTRKIKDLKSENKKKRKEPPKPWGKKERAIVLSVLLITMLTAITLTILARGFRLPSAPKLPSFESLNIFREQTIIFEDQ